MIDSHCHLDFAAFDDDRGEVLARAAAVGVREVVVPGVAPDQWPALPALRARHPGLHVAVGVHPMVVPDLDDAALDDALAGLEDAARRAGAVAIGECGLDGVVAKRDGGAMDRQRRVLDAHAHVARSLGLPLMLHVFRAQGEALERVRAHAPYPAGGVVHSYSGSAEDVAAWVELGFCLSFAGAVTRPNARRPRAAAAAVPPDRLLVETDAPDQTPHGAPTRRNEPGYLPGIVAAVAGARGEDAAAVARRTADNARRLFRLGWGASPGDDGA